MLFRSTSLGLVCLVAWSAHSTAQITETPSQEPLPTAEQIAASIQEVDAATDLDDAKKASIKQLYQTAATALESIGKFAEDAARYDAMISDASTNLAAVTEELSSLPKRPPAVDDSMTLTQLQQIQAETEAEILRRREEIAQLGRDVSARQVRQREVPVQLEAARKQLADINNQLARTAADGENPLLTRARKTLLQVQAKAVTNQITALEKELPAYAATTELLPKQRDLAGQKLTLAEAKQAASLNRIDELRRTEVSSQVEDAQRELEQTSGTLRTITETTLDYAKENQSILKQLKETADTRSATDRLLGDVTQEFQRTREKVETVGLTDALGIFLRSKRTQLAVLRGEHYSDRTRRGIVQTLQLKLLELEDVRANLTQLDLAAIEALEELQLDSADTRLLSQVRKLLESQRTVLDSLLQNQRTYFESLVALDSAERELVQQIDDYSSYIDGWILWVRSSPPLGLADIGNTVDAVGWLARPLELLELATTAAAGIRRRSLTTFVFALAFFALAFRQHRFRTRLRELGSRAESRRCREFAVTVEAAILTLIIAAVWPTLMFFVGWQLGTDSSDSLTVQALGWALVSSAAFLLLTEFTRQLLRSQGLAQCHFGWPERTRRSFSHHLRWFSLTTPLIFLVVFLGIQPNEQFHHSLGRITFLTLMAFSAFLALRTLRPSGPMFSELGERSPTSWAFRLRSIISAAAIGMPCLLFALAVAGYYYSAYQLAQRLMESVALAVALVTVMGLLLRWILIHRRRLTFDQKLAARHRAAEVETTETRRDFINEAETAVDLVEVTRQTRELIRVFVILTAFVSAWWIWNDVLPALEFLASVEVWRMNLTDRIEIITLKHLFSCALTFGLTFVAVKNVPGLLELLFLQRLPLDAGARYAVTTIARYALALVGVIIGFSFIHVEWSQYSWIVAAATVGLGFGLQEIFANFVSGLIVLLERPIRVGDVVTVDGTTGVVQRIHMRATVLRTWDHQELIVPNKEFVTTKLLNWTLSNSTNRVVITVGVAYGCDTTLARELMRRVVEEHPNVLEDPEPSVTFEEFGDSTLNFTIRCYLPQLDGRLATIHELHTEIHTQLRTAGIEIAFPQRDLHLRTVPLEWQPKPLAPPPNLSEDAGE